MAEPAVRASSPRAGGAATWAPPLLSVLRIVAAFTYMVHGWQKLFAYPTGLGPDGTGTVALGSLYGAAGIIETFGGGLLFVGLFTRSVAFITAGEMAVAYFYAHSPSGFWPLLNRGELPVVYCFIWLYLAAAGGGPWSVDAMLRRRRDLRAAA